MKKINEYKGVINTFANTPDFFKDYTYMSKSLLYKVSSNNKDSGIECGILLANTNETKYLKVQIPSTGYLHLMSYSNPDLPPIPTHTGLFNIVTNFFEIEVLCAYISEFDGIGDCTIGLVMASDKKIFSVDAYLHDIISLTMVKKFPIFIRRSLYKQYGMDRDELKGYSV